MSKPIHSTGQQWAVTSFGIECRDGTYVIAKDRLWENEGVHSWYVHMCEKDRVDQADFAQALCEARDKFRELFPAPKAASKPRATKTPAKATKPAKKIRVAETSCCDGTLSDQAGGSSQSDRCRAWQALQIEASASAASQIDSRRPFELGMGRTRIGAWQMMGTPFPFPVFIRDCISRRGVSMGAVRGDRRMGMVRCSGDASAWCDG